MNANPLRSLVPGLLIVLVASGCAPTIRNERIAPAAQGEPVIVAADIKPFLSSMRTPGVSFRELPSQTAWVPAGDMHEETANHYLYSHETGLDYGYYQARISVPYRYALLPFLGSTVQRTPDLWIDAAADCYAFDGAGPAPQGWRIDGVFDGDLTARKVAGDLAPMAWRDITNWPEAYKGSDPADLRGSVRFKIPTGIPADPDAYHSDETPGGEPDQQAFWRVSYLSPELSGVPHWQALTNLRLRFITNAAGLFLQPLVQVRESGGDVSLHRALNAPAPNGNFPVAGGATPAWHLIDARFELPGGAVVQQFDIRIYGRPDLANAFVGADSFLDGVCVGN